MALTTALTTSAVHASDRGGSDVACVIDLDNILHRGFGKGQSQLDVVSFAAALRNRGVRCGSVVRNRDFSVFADKIWSGFGFAVLATRKNCDDEVIEQAEAYARAGVRELILCAGDSDYCGMVKRIRSRRVRVECWTRRAKASAKLMAMTDGVRFIDSFLLTPEDSTTNDNTTAHTSARASTNCQLSIALRQGLLTFVSRLGARQVGIYTNRNSTVLRGVDKNGKAFSLEIDGEEKAWMDALNSPALAVSQ